jgi:hypothetical protein
VQKRNSLSLSANARNVVDKPHTGLTAALERAVEIVDGKADVVYRRPASVDEARDWRLTIVRLEELDQGFPGTESHNACPIGIIQLDLGQSEHIAEERDALFERSHCDSNVGYADSAWGCRGH